MLGVSDVARSRLSLDCSYNREYGLVLRATRVPGLPPARSGPAPAVVEPLPFPSSRLELDTYLATVSSLFAALAAFHDWLTLNDNRPCIDDMAGTITKNVVPQVGDWWTFRQLL